MDHNLTFIWKDDQLEIPPVDNNNVEYFQNMPLASQLSQEDGIVLSDEMPNEYNLCSNTTENIPADEVILEQWEDGCVEVVIGDEQSQEEVLLPKNRHEYSLSDPYICDFCNIIFRDHDEYLDHRAVHNENDIYFECPFSSNESVTRNEYLIHDNMNKYTDGAVDNDLPLECELCGDGFATEEQLLTHMCKNEEGSLLECNLCNENFLNKKSLKEHLEKTHVNQVETPFETEIKNSTHVCAACGLSFCYLRDLRSHQQCHVDVKFEDSELGFSCNLCGLSFSNNSALIFHTNKEHGGCFDNLCLVCGENFIDEESRNEHIQRQHPDSEVSNYIKKDVNKKSRSPKLIKKYEENVFNNQNNQPYTCKECGKKFSTRGSEQIHMRKHTGERPYPCSFCNKAFSDGGTLRKHERIHTGEKPYACVVCPRAFNQRVVLRDHIKTHHSSPNELYVNSTNPYICTICSDRFSDSKDLTAHLIHHCDLNTAMKRSAKVGPRKYIRRRKLQLHKYDDQDEQSEEESYVQSEVKPLYEIDKHDRYTNLRHMPSQKKCFEHQMPSTEINYSALGSTSSNSESQNVIDCGVSAKKSLKVSKAKMIHTENKQYSNDVRKRGKYHSKRKYMKDFDAASEGTNAVKNLLEFGSVTTVEDVELSYCESKGEQTADSESTNRENFVTRQSSRKTKRLFPHNNFLQTFDETTNEIKKNETDKNNDFNTKEVHKDQIARDALHEFAEISMQHANNVFRCEMCDTTFLEKAQLITHILIHI